MMRKISLLLLLYIPAMCVYGTVLADSLTCTYDALDRIVKAEYGNGAYAEYGYDDAGNMTRKTHYEISLLVRLAEFTAEMSDGCVILTWKTLSETDNAGFHILRSESENGKYVRITALMISAQGEATRGAVYSYRDCGEGQIYYYKLEDIDYQGVSSCEGPVSPFPAGTSQDVNTAYLRDVIVILQINAGMKVSAPADMETYAGNDGKAGMEDAVRLLQVVSGLRKW